MADKKTASGGALDPKVKKQLEEDRKRRQQQAKTGASTTVPSTLVASAGGVTAFDTTGNGGASTSVNASGTPAKQYEVVSNVTLDMSGIAGVGGKNGGKILSNNWSTAIQKLDKNQLTALQDKLWKGGFYTNDYYYQNGMRPAYGSHADEGLSTAWLRFAAAASQNPTIKGAEILQIRAQQSAGLLNNAATGGQQDSLNVMVEPTQALAVPKDAALGAIADAAAQKVLGRNLKPGPERDHYIEMIRASMIEAGMTEADINAYNRGLTRQAAGQEAAYSNTQTANIASGLTGSMADYARAIRTVETTPEGLYKKHTEGKGSSASGAYQITDPLWGNYKGIKHAKDASPAIQDEFFAKKFGEYIQKYGTPELAAVAWFQGPGAADLLKKGDKSVLAKNDSLGTTTSAYIKKFQKALAASTGKTAPGAQGSTAGGMRTVSTVTGDYKGSVSTPSGGNVVITPSNENIQATVEEAIKKENPTEAGAVGFRQGFDVFERLMRGGY